MTDRARAPLDVQATRIGRADLGPSTAIVEEDALVLLVRRSADERRIRIPLAVLDTAGIAGKAVSLLARDGMQIVLKSSAAADLIREILARCQTLPELTRTLRAFGSRRGRRSTRDTEASEQQRFFAPLISARRAAMHAERPEATIAAFDVPSLVVALHDTLITFAAQRHGNDAPARRALEAELVDLSEPLQLSLNTLGEEATAAAEAPGDLRLWRAWATQLRATFESADRVWLAIDAVLDATEPDRAAKR